VVIGLKIENLEAFHSIYRLSSKENELWIYSRKPIIIRWIALMTL